MDLNKGQREATVKMDEEFVREYKRQVAEEILEGEIAAGRLREFVDPATGKVCIVEAEPPEGQARTVPKHISGTGPVFTYRAMAKAEEWAVEHGMTYPMRMSIESKDGKGFAYVVPASGAKPIGWQEWDHVRGGETYPMTIVVDECDLAGVSSPEHGRRYVSTIFNASVQ
jgi:hypothetical protein